MAAVLAEGPVLGREDVVDGRAPGHALVVDQHVGGLKIDHLKTGGTLLNQKFTPDFFKDDRSIRKITQLIRGYFRMDGHHVQFDVVTAETLRKALDSPEEHRDLIVRVAGYSDYFCDLSDELQSEILERTEHGEV